MFRFVYCIVISTYRVNYKKKFINRVKRYSPIKTIQYYNISCKKLKIEKMYRHRKINSRFFFIYFIKY